MASPRADVRSRKDPLVSGKEVDWRGFEGSKGATEESSEIKWPEWVQTRTKPWGPG